MILIVEDDPMIAGIIAEVCHEADHETEIVADGLSAVQRAGSAAYSLILMDLHLIGQGGMSAALQIGELWPPFGTVPIIMLTAGLDAANIDKMKPDTFAGALQKPFSRENLTAMIERFARR